MRPCTLGKGSAASGKEKKTGHTGDQRGCLSSPCQCSPSVTRRRWSQERTKCLLLGRRCTVSLPRSFSFSPSCWSSGDKGSLTPFLSTPAGARAAPTACTRAGLSRAQGEATRGSSRWHLRAQPSTAEMRSPECRGAGEKLGPA